MFRRHTIPVGAPHSGCRVLFGPKVYEQTIGYKAGFADCWPGEELDDFLSEASLAKGATLGTLEAGLVKYLLSGSLGGMTVGLVITAIVLVYLMIISPGFRAVVIVLLIGVVALVAWVATRSNEMSWDLAQAEAERFATTVIVGLHDFGDFIHIFHDEILAMAAVVIAIFSIIMGIFTISLSRSTRIAANVAKQSAEALSQSERAHIFAKVLEWSDISEATTVGNEEGLQRDGPIPASIKVEFCFENHGKTPAVLKMISRDIVYWASPPKWHIALTGNIPVVGLPREGDEIVDSGRETKGMNCEATNLVVRQAQSVIRGRLYVWFYGRVIYDDVFGATHEHRFIYRRDTDGRLRSFSHPEYSKNT